MVGRAQPGGRGGCVQGVLQGRYSSLLGSCDRSARRVDRGMPWRCTSRRTRRRIGSLLPNEWQVTSVRSGPRRKLSGEEPVEEPVEEPKKGRGDDLREPSLPVPILQNPSTPSQRHRGVVSMRSWASAEESRQHSTGRVASSAISRHQSRVQKAVIERHYKGLSVFLLPLSIVLLFVLLVLLLCPSPEDSWPNDCPYHEDGDRRP